MIPRPPNKRLKAGTLTHPVKVQKPVRETLINGERVVADWATVASRYASIEALSGREIWLGRQVEADVTHGIKMRFVPGMDSSWSILWGAKRLLLATPPLDPVGDGEQVGFQAVLQTS